MQEHSPDLVLDSHARSLTKVRFRARLKSASLSLCFSLDAPLRAKDHKRGHRGAEFAQWNTGTPPTQLY